MLLATTSTMCRSADIVLQKLYRERRPAIQHQHLLLPPVSDNYPPTARHAPPPLPATKPRAIQYGLLLPVEQVDIPARPPGGLLGAPGRPPIVARGLRSASLDQPPGTSAHHDRDDVSAETTQSSRGCFADARDPATVESGKRQGLRGRDSSRYRLYAAGRARGSAVSTDRGALIWNDHRWYIRNPKRDQRLYRLAAAPMRKLPLERMPNREPKKSMVQLTRTHDQEVTARTVAREEKLKEVQSTTAHLGPSRDQPMALILASMPLHTSSTTSRSRHLALPLSKPTLNTPRPHPFTVSGRTSPCHPT